MKTKLTLLIAVLLAVASTASLGQPTITLQPTNFPVLSLGASVGNRVLASGAAPLSYQWRKNGVPISGRTTSSIIITNLQLSDAGAYDVVVTNAAGSAISSVVTLEVDPTFTKIVSGPLVTDLEGSVTGHWADYDGDGFVDIFVANSIGSGTTRNTLYHNDGGTNFSRVNTTPLISDYMRTWMAAWADYDNDGNPDLIIANLDGGLLAQRLYRNNGDGSFTSVVDSALRSDSNAAACPWWFDYNQDGFLDLFVAKGPSFSTAANDCLFQNQRDGTFRKTTAAEVGSILLDQQRTEACYIVDFDNDGHQELVVTYVAADMAPSCTIWRPQVDGIFQVVPKDLPANKVPLSWGDYDNDGLPDALCLTSESSLGVALYRNLGGGGFADSTGVLNATTPMATFNATWGDYDNDGWLDLYCVGWRGSAGVLPGNLFRNNRDGTFTQILTGSFIYDSDRVCSPSWADYNNDGFLDLFIAAGDALPRINYLYHNNGNSNHWLKVKLEGRASNRSSIGAKVRAQATANGQTFWQVREIGSGNVYGGQSILPAHFGLGDATNVTTLRIEWPSGIVQELQNVAANQILTVVESQGYTGASPQFSGAAKIIGTGVRISFTEPAAGARYIVEGSTNLVTWTKLMVRTSVGAGTNYIDSNSPKLARRFYRLAVP